MFPKKIHIVSTFFLPVTAGLERQIFEVYSRFVKQGWEVVVHTTNRMPGEGSRLPKLAEYEGIMVKRYNRLAFSVLPFFAFNYSEKFILEVEDMITLPGLPIFTMSTILKYFGLKRYILVFSSHGLFGYTTKIYPTLKMYLKNKIDRGIGVFFLNKSVDGIRAVSETEKNVLVAGGVEERLIHIITNGIEDAAFADIESQVSAETKLKVKNFGKYILQVARIDRVKNQAVIIQAMNFIPNEYKLLLMGPIADKLYYSELVKLIQQNMLDNRVAFTGVIRDSEKYYYLKHAEVVAHMSKLEGYCLSVLEAMSQGSVFVVSKKTALEELVKEELNGYLANCDDPKEVAEKLNLLLNPDNANIVSKMRLLNKEFCKNKSWDIIVSDVQKFYQGLYSTNS